MEPIPSLLPAQRQARVLALVQERGSATVQELTRDLAASVSTIRRDLDLLAQQGLVVRTHGGALAQTHTAAELRFDERRGQHTQEKNRIGQHALSLLEPHQSVYFDSSTTVLAVVEALRGSPLPLTAITHDVAVAAALADLPHVGVILPGGELRPGSYTLVGSATSSFLHRLHVDIALLGIHAVRGGRLTEGSLGVAELKRVLLGAATRRVLLADHSKFNQTALIDVGALTSIHDLVTGEETPRSVLSDLQLSEDLRLHVV